MGNVQLVEILESSITKINSLTEQSRIWKLCARTKTMGACGVGNTEVMR